jgi:integrase
VASAHWLDKLEAEHLEKLYTKMIRAGSKPGTAHHGHRTIRNALNEAKRRGHLSQNPALLAKAPKLADDETEPYTVIEVRRLLALVDERRNGPRWVVALALGATAGRDARTQVGARGPRNRPAPNPP